MVGVMSVAKSKKEDHGDNLDAVAARQIAEDGPVKGQVRLRPKFKAALHRVAQEADLDMGILIEKYMTRFITREDLRIARERVQHSSEGELEE